MKLTRYLGVAVLAALALSACSTSTPSPAASPWDAFVEEFIEHYFAAHPNEAVSAGRHDYDGQLPDWSADAIRKESERLEHQRARALSFANDSLSERQQFERDYLVAHIDKTLFWVNTAEAPFNNPQSYSDGLDPNVYVTREYAPAEVRIKAFSKYARAVHKAAAQIQANLRLPMAAPLLAQGILIFKGLADYISKDVRDAFAGVKDAALQTELKAASAEAAQAYLGLVAWLESHQKTANQKFRLGTDKFNQMLWATERVNAPLGEIQKAGKASLDASLARLRKICETYALGESLRKCVDKAEAHKPPEGSLAAARKLLPELKQFIQSTGIVSIPGTEEALVRESPPYMRWNLAYIDIPGPYEKGLPSIYYISPPDPKWSAKEQAEYIMGSGSLADTSIHEVWPGHFLQFLHANRVKSRFGQLFGSYAFIEGWALYVEELMVEGYGYGKDNPELQIGQILGSILRDVRLLSAIGMHTGQMTMKDSEKLFREKALTDPGTARQQAARGTFDPGYLNYTLGKLMIRRLRDTWSAVRGGKAAWRRFHDEFLSYGAPPIPLLRKQLLGAQAAAGSSIF